MPKTVRMSDIAARAGVSTVTVSKALAGKEGVSEEIRAKIKALADEMSYRQPSFSKREQKKTGNIGILIPAGYVTKSRSFYWEIYEMLVSCLTAAGYYGILEMVQREEEKRLIQPRVLQDEKIDGLIFMGQTEHAYREMLRKRSQIPTVFLDSYDIMNDSDCIISDGYHGMCTITNHLIELGHKKIDFVGSLHSTSSIIDRYFGYCRVMMEHGLDVTPDMVIPDRHEDGAIDIHLPEELPTAFVCNCDLAACEVIHKLGTRGLKVPEDISVTGFDDYVYSGLISAGLTTYAVDINAMVHVCLNHLMKKIYNSHYSSNLMTISGHLIIRDTTKALHE